MMKSYMVMVVGSALLALESAAYGYTYSDYTWYSFGGHEYAATFTRGPWVSAQAEAAANGWNLVTINDAAENTWLTSRFDAAGSGWSAIWIGYERIFNYPGDLDPAHDTWVWVSGEPITYSPPWAYTPYYGTGDHAYLHTASHWAPATWNDNSWHDAYSSHYLRGIIENPVIPAPGAIVLVGVGAGLVGCLRKQGIL